MDLLLHLLAFSGGAAIVSITILSVVRTLVLPRSARDPVASIVFRGMRRLFDVQALRAMTYEQRDRIMALYAPISLLVLPIVWLTLIGTGYTLIYWALNVESLYEAFTLSGSSLLTLGFERKDRLELMIGSFSEAALGLILVALLISYLPTIYSAFSRREAAVTLLEVRAGLPPSAATMITRAHRIRGLQVLPELYVEWEKWFADLEESHTSLAALVFFRSPKPERSWITAAGAVLDSAALYASTLDVPRNPQADLCIRAGYIALRSIADFFQISYDPDPAPDDPISISRAEFDALYDELASLGVPLKPDRDQCWRDFAGWRVNYDRVLLALATLTMAPYAPWVSDRSLPHRRTNSLFRGKRTR